MEQTGRLYLCATPIGNLADITYRAVETLRTADVIAAEDTRHTRGLLAHYDIHTPMTSYHEHNKEEKGTELIERLRAGATVVCVCRARMPHSPRSSARDCRWRGSPSSAFSRARRRSGARFWRASPPIPRH